MSYCSLVWKSCVRLKHLCLFWFVHRKRYQHNYVTFQCVYVYNLYSFVNGGLRIVYIVVLFIHGLGDYEWYKCLRGIHSWMKGMRMLYVCNGWIVLEGDVFSMITSLRFERSFLLLVFIDFSILFCIRV